MNQMDYEWTITIRANCRKGAMDAVWKCWEAWQRDNEPLSGNGQPPFSNHYDFTCRRQKAPKSDPIQFSQDARQVTSPLTTPPLPPTLPGQ